MNEPSTHQQNNVLWHLFFKITSLLPPANEVCEGCFHRTLCVHRVGVSARWVSAQGGGVSAQGGVGVSDGGVCLGECLSVHRGVEVCHTTPTPWADTPLGRHTPLDTHTPRQTPPWVDTLPGRHFPWADTPLGRHPPLPSACWDTVNKRAVRIPLECILINVFLSTRNSF